MNNYAAGNAEVQKGKERHPTLPAPTQRQKVLSKTFHFSRGNMRRHLRRWLKLLFKLVICRFHQQIYQDLDNIHKGTIYPSIVITHFCLCSASWSLPLIAPPFTLATYPTTRNFQPNFNTSRLCELAGSHTQYTCRTRVTSPRGQAIAFRLWQSELGYRHVELFKGHGSMSLSFDLGPLLMSLCSACKCLWTTFSALFCTVWCHCG